MLAHGVTDAGPCWTPVAEALAAEYDAIMVDARGHGHSDAPERSYGPAEQADDLAGVTALESKRPAVLGHSMGAATALVLAYAHPDLAGAILLEDPPAWWTGWSDTPAALEGHVAMRERSWNFKRKSREELIAASVWSNPTGQTPNWNPGRCQTAVQSKRPQCLQSRQRGERRLGRRPATDHLSGAADHRRSRARRDRYR